MTASFSYFHTTADCLAHVWQPLSPLKTLLFLCVWPWRWHEWSMRCDTCVSATHSRIFTKRCFLQEDGESHSLWTGKMGLCKLTQISQWKRPKKLRNKNRGHTKIICICSSPQVAALVCFPGWSASLNSNQQLLQLQIVYTLLILWPPGSISIPSD